MVIEGSVDLPVIVDILLEDVPKEHRLRAVFSTESSCPLHQSRQYHLFIGWVMMGLGVEVEIGVCVCVRVRVRACARKNVSVQGYLMLIGGVPSNFNLAFNVISMLFCGLYTKARNLVSLKEEHIISIWYVLCLIA
jgi:hypothetical protein